MYNSLTKYVFWNRETSIFEFSSVFVYEKAEEIQIKKEKNSSCFTSQQLALTDISEVQDLQEFSREAPTWQRNSTNEYSYRIYCLYKLKWKYDYSQNVQLLTSKVLEKQNM